MRRRLTAWGLGLGTWAMVLAMSSDGSAQYSKKTLVAHRGASAYAPEHTLSVYKLAIEQGADFVEQDLAVTKDGALICLHDASLERTTNVEDLFPDRAITLSIEGKTRRAWVANDFTLAEIKTLDAGSWFDKKFAGEKVPTFDEAVTLIKGKAGLFPELKTPEIYEGRKVDFEELVAAALDQHGLRGPKADPKTPVILQTFGQASARELARIKIGVPVVLLLGSPAGFETAEGVKGWKGIVPGPWTGEADRAEEPGLREVGPRRGHDRDAVHVPRRDTGSFKDVTAEMDHYLYTLGVDALFTDNPDKFPRK